MHLLAHCGSLGEGERVLLLTDSTTRDLVGRFMGAAGEVGALPTVIEIAVGDRHGLEPPPAVADEMANVDLVVALTKMSFAHTRARRQAAARGTRYLSMPGYSVALLADPCIRADYRGQEALVRSIAAMFSAGSAVRVTTRGGTNLTLGIIGREGNCCPGFVSDDYLLGSPPDIEANVSPAEWESAGTIVVDGSVTSDEIGLVDSPITLTISGGRIVRFGSERPDYISKLTKLFAAVGDSRAYTLAECGIGLNPLARLTGNMLTDEGVLGSVHFGFGSNITVGGMNEVAFHIDCVAQNASLWIDEHQILEEGELCVRSTR